MQKNIRVKRSDEKWLKGVIGGFSQHYRVSPLPFRVLTVAVALVMPMTLVLLVPAYIYAATHMRKI